MVLILSKIKNDYFIIPGEENKISKDLPLVSDVLETLPLATATGFNYDDVERNALFPRSLFGEWTISINKKGNAEPLPDVSKIIIKFNYSHGQI